jgi:RHS repeat-associated protein
VSQTLAYNARNQLLSTATTTYIYDAEGTRRTQTVGGIITRYTTEPNSKLSRCLIKHNVTAGTKTYYVYGLGLLYEVNKVGTTAETRTTYHYDQVGSTIARTDETGHDVGRAEYSPYGVLTWKTGNMNTPFLYNGMFGVMTDSNGLICMRARYYSPYLMRFLNADPSGFSGGSNWFCYANGNPISANDPLGLCSEGGNSCTAGWDGRTDRAYTDIFEAPSTDLPWAEAWSKVPDWLAKNGWNSAKRNLSDPKFIMEMPEGDSEWQRRLSGFWLRAAGV